MARHRRHLAAACVAALTGALAGALIVPSPAAGASDDVFPAARDGIPSPRAEAIAPRYRVFDEPGNPAARPKPKPQPEAGVALAPADRTQGASGPVAAHGAVDPAKPGIPAEEASPENGAPGAPKSTERLDSPSRDSAPPDLPAEEPAAEAPPAEEPGDATTDATAIEMVRVPAPIVKAARRALPGIVFTSVDLSRSGASTVYALSGTSASGRIVSVAVDQFGKALKVDRQVRDTEIPSEIVAIAEAVLPVGRIDRAMLSLRPDFVAFYAFTGSTETGLPFGLDIRSDGRNFSFVDPD